MTDTKFYKPENNQRKFFENVLTNYYDHGERVVCFNSTDGEPKKMYHMRGCTVFINRNSEANNTITGEESDINKAKSLLEELGGR